MEGTKYDTDKLRYDLIPEHPLRLLAEVYTIGAKKYADRNWEKGIGWGRIFAACMRHLWAWWRGEKNDPVDGQHHLASVAWCAFALMEYENTHKELDDRPNARKESKTNTKSNQTSRDGRDNVCDAEGPTAVCCEVSVQRSKKEVKKPEYNGPYLKKAQHDGAFFRLLNEALNEEQ